jgi:HSP20 family protein
MFLGSWHGLCLLIDVDGTRKSGSREGLPGRKARGSGSGGAEDPLENQAPVRLIPPNKFILRRYGMKTVTMYRPNTIQNALSDFDRYFESFFGDSHLAPASRIFNHLPAVDVRETEKAYILDMELPGYDEKGIEIHVDSGSLSIESRQEETKEDKKNEGTYILRERRLNAFSRSFKLPENVDSENISASFKNGILTLEIRKRAEAQKRMIKINSN